MGSDSGSESGGLLSRLKDSTKDALERVQEKLPLVQPGYGSSSSSSYEPQYEMFGDRRVMVPRPPRMGRRALKAIGTRKKLIVKQLPSRVEKVCKCCCCERPNKYDILDAETRRRVLHAEEESGFRHRCCCNPNHALTLQIMDEHDHVLATMDRPFKCCGVCPTFANSCQQQATLYARDHTDSDSEDERETYEFGRAQQPMCGGCFTPQVNVALGLLDPQEDNFAAIHGPSVCYGGVTELCRDHEFYISSHGQYKTGDLGMIVKERPDSEDFKALKQELKTEYDEFSLTFTNDNLSPHQRLTLLSSLLLMDYMFFERAPSCKCNPCAPAMSCTLFNFYMCGAICPISLKCGLTSPVPDIDTPL